MELKEEFKKRPKEQKEENEDLKGQIVELKKIVALQSEQIESLREDISILVGVFNKYGLVFSERIDEFTQQAKELKTGSDELKKGMKEGIKEGAKEIIEESVQNSFNGVLESLNKKINGMKEQIVSISDKMFVWDILNFGLSGVVVLIIILGLVLGWQFRNLRNETGERLYKIEKIQDRLTNLTIEEGKYWYSEKDKQAYFQRVEEIKNAKEQEKAKK